MPGYLERTVDFTPGPVGNFDAIADQIDPTFHSMAKTAMMAIHGGGEEYDPTVENFTYAGPRSDADTPVGAGNVTLDLLRYVSAARQHRLFFQKHEEDKHTGNFTMTHFNIPKDEMAAAEYTEILGVAHHLQPVLAIAIQYVLGRTRRKGALLEPSAIHLNARLSHDPTADLKTVFTNVSIDDETHSFNHPDTRYLTVTTGQERSLSIQRPERPPSFHHVRIWTQLLQNIVAR
jgi:hypothetical protein